MARNDDESNPFASPEADDRLYDDQLHDVKIEYASFLTRLGAYIVDGIITNILGFALGMGVGVIFHIIDLNGIARVTAMILGATATWLYFAIQESSSIQATIGKKIVGIKVVDMDGKRISFGRASGRYFGKILSFIIFFVGYLLQPFTEKRQTLHDIMSGCLVIKE